MEKHNNKVYLRGVVASETRFSHEVYGEGFYEADIAVKRLSGQEDLIPVTVSERIMSKEELEKGKSVSIIGQFRSYNKLVNGKSKLMLTVFVREKAPFDFSPNPNCIVLSGYLCKQPTYRTTPFSREIADMLVAVNRAYNKSDYIPCIAWGRNARFVKNIGVGEKIALSGRIQSRTYQKKISETEIKTLIAYEVSVSRLAAYENADKFDLDGEFSFEDEKQLRNIV